MPSRSRVIWSRLLCTTGAYASIRRSSHCFVRFQSVPLRAGFHSPAAYNAGYAATDRWLRESAAQPLDEWIERIPYRETRRYTRRVLQTYGKNPVDVPGGAASIAPWNTAARPWTTTTAPTLARANRQIFFRRALKVVNGGLNQLPAPGLTIDGTRQSANIDRTAKPGFVNASLVLTRPPGG